MSSITCSSSRSRIWPCAICTRASGTSTASSRAVFSMVFTSLCRKNTWPPRFNSRRKASRMRPLSHSRTKVLIARRRRRDDGEIAHAGQRQVHGAWDRRRGEREDVHLAAQALEPFFLTHAETVFLVDDGEAEAFELYAFLQELVRADDDVHAAVGQSLHDGFLLFS